MQDWNDVVVGLPPEARRQLIESGRQQLAEGGAATSEAAQASLLGDPGPELGEMARRALESLKVDAATHLDDLLEKVEDISPSELIAALFELEMLGLVKQLPARTLLKCGNSSLGNRQSSLRRRALHSESLIWQRLS